MRLSSREEEDWKLVMGGMIWGAVFAVIAMCLILF